MAAGTDTVKQAIAGQFGAVQISERHDFNTKDTILDFASDGHSFSVEVSHEYDTDYGSGQLKVDLKRLAEILRASKERKAIIMRGGIRSAA